MSERTELGDAIRSLVDLAEDPAKRRKLEGRVRDLGTRFVKRLEDPHYLIDLMSAGAKHKIDVREVRKRRRRR